MIGSDPQQPAGSTDAAAPALDESPASRTPRPVIKRFRAPKFEPADPELVVRQHEAVTLAFKSLGSVDAARSYLNEVDEQLGGRPIDIAGASPDGLRRVSVSILTLAAPPRG